MNRRKAHGRRLFLGVAAGLALTPWSIANAAARPAIRVFKTATCGCCGMRVEHLEASGFSVEVENLADLNPIKQMAGLPDHLLACHTGITNDYIVEGHVPAMAIKKLLAERPAIRGLAVPGMPAGSPGMPSSTPERYDVIAFGGEHDHVFMSFVETNPA